MSVAVGDTIFKKVNNVTQFHWPKGHPEESSSSAVLGLSINTLNESDIWDDSALIEAYDNAVSNMQKQLSGHGIEVKQNTVKEGKDRGKSNQKRKRKKKAKNKKDNRAEASSSHSSIKWRAGHHCRAVYTEDGEIYEAVIKSVDLSSNTAMVRFLGYGNEEEQELDDLLPSEVMTRQQRRASQTSDLYSESDTGTEGGHAWPQAEARRSVDSRASSRGRGKRGSSPVHGLSGPSGHRPMGPMPGWAGGPPHFPSAPTPFSQPWQGQHLFNPMQPLIGGAPPMMPPMFASPDFLNSPFSPGKSMPSVPPPPPPLLDPDEIQDDKEALHNMLISWYISGYNTGFYQGLREGKDKQRPSQSAASKEETEQESNSRKT